ncbi:MAG: hypothetical protein U0412_11725 [Nitrospira sp.]
MAKTREVPTILFVCTGNVFRSVTAEYALKARADMSGPYRIESAGIAAKPQPLHPFVRDQLHERGVNPVGHAPRRVTQAMLNEAEHVIAMGWDHRDAIHRMSGRLVPLFNQICFGRDEPVWDLHEVMPQWEHNPEEARAYVESVIRHIWSAAPLVVSRLPSIR